MPMPTTTMRCCERSEAGELLIGSFYPALEFVGRSDRYGRVPAPRGYLPTEPPSKGEDEHASLLVMTKTGVFTCVLPDSGEVVLGRAPECDIRLDDGRVSRRHVLLR